MASTADSRQRNLQRIPSAETARRLQQCAALTDTFRSCLAVLVKLNIWGSTPGPPKIKGDGGMYSELPSHLLLSGKPANGDYLNMMSISETRISDYAAKYYMGDDVHSTGVRKNTDNNFKHVQCLQEDVYQQQFLFVSKLKPTLMY